MIISNNILLLFLMMINVKGHQARSNEISKVRNVFNPPFCHIKEPKCHKKQAGILDPNNITVVMALLALATVLTQ